MATTAELMAALDKLTADGDQFPGMPSVKTIIENYIKKKYPEYEQFDTPEERQQFIKKYGKGTMDYYKSLLKQN